MSVHFEHFPYYLYIVLYKGLNGCTVTKRIAALGGRQTPQKAGTKKGGGTQSGAPFGDRPAAPEVPGMQRSGGSAALAMRRRGRKSRLDVPAGRQLAGRTEPRVGGGAEQSPTAAAGG